MGVGYEALASILNTVTVFIDRSAIKLSSVARASKISYSFMLASYFRPLFILVVRRVNYFFVISNLSTNKGFVHYVGFKMLAGFAQLFLDSCFWKVVSALLYLTVCLSSLKESALRRPGQIRRGQQLRCIEAIQ